MVRRIAAIGMMLVTVTGLAACGGEDDDDAADDGPSIEASPAQPSDDDAAADDAEPADGDGRSCTLLSAGDVATATGEDVTDGPTPNELAPTDECTFQLANGDGISIVFYSESEATALGPDTYDDAAAVDGVGDEAWYSASLHVAQARVSDGVISVQHVTTGEDAAVAMLTVAAG